jgi:hypothetical protein
MPYAAEAGIRHPAESDPILSTELHRCLAGPACRQAEKIDGKRHGARTIEAHALCDACTKHIADCARQLPSDYRMLAESLGERRSDTTEFVKSTPTPAIPINAGAEAIMSAICEIADRAAAVVSDQLKTEQPTGRVRLPDIDIKPEVAEKLGITPGKRPASVGTVALRTHDDSRPAPISALIANSRLIEPNIDVLAEAPAESHFVWERPQRCAQHDTLITSAEAWLSIAPPHDRDKAKDELTDALRKAGACDDCNGWSTDHRWGQARGSAVYTGLDIAQQIRDIHHQARAHLGHTRLRLHYTMPCPAVDKHGYYCGALTLGRNDGSDWVDCTTCGTQWTEREYDWLKTQIAGDKEIEMLRWLLAEAYWRLDTLQRGANAIRNDPRLDEPGSGQFVLDGIDIILNAGDGHQPPDKRQTTPDRKKGKGKR